MSKIDQLCDQWRKYTVAQSGASIGLVPGAVQSAQYDLDKACREFTAIIEAQPAGISDPVEVDRDRLLMAAGAFFERMNNDH